MAVTRVLAVAAVALLVTGTGRATAMEKATDTELTGISGAGQCQHYVDQECKAKGASGPCPFSGCNSDEVEYYRTAVPIQRPGCVKNAFTVGKRCTDEYLERDLCTINYWDSANCTTD